MANLTDELNGPAEVSKIMLCPWISQLLSSKRRLFLILAAILVACEMFLASQQRSITRKMAEETDWDVVDTLRKWVNVGNEDKVEDVDLVIDRKEIEEKVNEIGRVAGDAGADPDKEGESGLPGVFRDVLYPAEGKVRAFNMYDEDYSDQEEVDAIEKIAEGKI